MRRSITPPLRATRGRGIIEALAAGFRAPVVARLSGVPYRTLDYWDHSGFLCPSISSANGHGSRREYSFADLVALRVSRVLRERGISLQNLRKVQQRLASYRRVEQPLASSRLVVISGKNPDVARVEIAEDAERLESLLSAPGQTVSSSAVILFLAPVVAELRKRVQAEDGATPLKRKNRRVARSTSTHNAALGSRKEATA